MHALTRAQLVLDVREGASERVQGVGKVLPFSFTVTVETSDGIVRDLDLAASSQSEQQMWTNGLVLLLQRAAAPS